MASVNGTAGSDSLDGGDGADSFLLQDGGDDSVRGAGGNDGFYFGGALTGADSVDGGDGSDSIAIQGNYAAGLTFGDLRSFETFLLLSGADTRFGDTAGNRYSYNVTTTDANLAAGATLSVIATGLLANENLAFDGSAEHDGKFRVFAGTGVDTLVGGSGSDGFFFGASANLNGSPYLGATTGFDRIDGGAGIDTVALRGDYAGTSTAIAFHEASLANVEVLAFLSGHSNEFTGTIAPEGYNYRIIMADGNVAAGARMDINATGLQADEFLRFVGDDETDGSFRILSGAGNDTLAGGHGNDIIYGGYGIDDMRGGGGNDIFVFRAVGEAAGPFADTISDFSAGDSIDLGAIDANSLTAARESFTFIGEAAFSGAAGELRTVRISNEYWSVQADVDGDRNTDMIISVRVDPGNSLALTGSTLAVAIPRVIDEVEPNDSRGTAQEIQRGWLSPMSNPDLTDPSLPSATIHGAIGSNGDSDYFRITLAAGEKLILDVDHTNNGLDALLSVYGPDGILLGDNDDPGFDDHGSDPTGAYPDSPHTTDSFLSFRAPVSGTYTFSIQSFDGESSGAYDLQVSLGPPATAAQLQQEDVEALISGAQWPDPNVTYSFPNGIGDYPDYEADSEPYDNFNRLTQVQQNVVRSALATLSGYTDLAFTEVAADPANALIRYGISGLPETSYAFYPASDPHGGDVWFGFDGRPRVAPVLGDYTYATILHETGHALGLKHGHEFPALSPDHDSLEYSVMTYRSYPGANVVDGGYTNEDFGFPQTYMMFDIAALQQMYGADFTTQSGDSIYSWSPDSGQMSIDGIGQAVAGANRVFMTIWDGGGNDTYDLSNYANAVTIDLRPGEWTITSPVQLANLGDGHMARGNVANALLYNGDPHSLIENAIGGSAGDLLVANQATNHLTGNGGADTFRWSAASDSSPGSADTIDDYQSGLDRIDLSGIDADSRTAGDDAFHWIGSGAFSGAAGELRGEVIGGSLHIFADVNADMVADFELILANQPALVDLSAFIF